MTRTWRRFIFWIFVTLFFVASIIMILYAQGWRLDLNSFKVVKTGGIFIKTSVSDAKIYINDKYAGSTSGILNYTKLVSNLTPQNYNVFIYKENYYPWNKVIDVKSGLVSELFYITLFPLELKKTKVAEFPEQTVYNFSTDGKTVKIINSKKSKISRVYDFTGKLISNENFKTSTSTEIVSPDNGKNLNFIDDKIFVNYLIDTQKEPYKKAGDKEIISAEPPISFLDWLKDSEHIIWFSNGELTISEIDSRGGKRNSVKFYLNINPPLFLDRENSDVYFFETGNGKLVLYKINID